MSATDPLQQLQRSRGVLRLGFVGDGCRTVLGQCYQEGAAKARFPRSRGRHQEAILINIGGGLTDGDRLQTSINVGAGAHAVLATQAAEKIYRSRNAAASVEMRVEIASGGALDWLPQETILFDRSHLQRRQVFRLAANAKLVAVECLVFGRHAHGEVVRSATLHDRFDVYRKGELSRSDRWRIEGDIEAALSRAAIGNGNRALGTILVVAPELSSLRDCLRPVLEALQIPAGCTLVGDTLALRLLAPRGHELRLAVVQCLTVLRQEIYGHVMPLPRVWQC